MSKNISDKLKSFVEIIKKDEEENNKNNIEHQELFELIKKVAIDVEEIRKAVI